MYYYKFNIGDYHSHTAHLDPLEDIAYRRMLDWCYLHERPLPTSKNEIARLIRMQSHCECIANVLSEFFSRKDGGYFSGRIAKEINAFQNKSEKAKQSANTRWNKETGEPSKTKGSSDANALRPLCEGNANHKPLNTNQLKESKPKKTATRFSTPSESDIQKYESEKGLNLTGFHDYYESNGWRVGRNPMRDWRASARGWSKRQVTNRQNNETNQRTPKNKTEQFYETLQTIHERSVDN